MMVAPMLLSLPAGVVADRMGKRTVILAVKWLELALLLAGSSILYLRPSGVLPALAVLVLLGMQAVFLSPARYGILPELLPHERLSAGNGLIEMVKPLALVSGVVVGGMVLTLADGRPWLVGVGACRSIGRGPDRRVHRAEGPGGEG